MHTVGCRIPLQIVSPLCGSYSCPPPCKLSPPMLGLLPCKLCCCHRPHVCLLLPPLLQAVTAHTAFPCGALVGGSSSASSLCIPNIIQVLAEIREMGQGIVADIVTVPSCDRIGWVV